MKNLLKNKRISFLLSLLAFTSPFVLMPSAWAAKIIGLGNLPGSSSPVYAMGVSADGKVVVGICRNYNNKDEAFRWTQESGMVGLGFLPGYDTGNEYYSQALSISSDGNIVVGVSYLSPGHWQAFYWTKTGGMIGLGFLPGGHSSAAESISYDGRVVVGQSTNASGSVEAFYWTSASGMIGLGFLSGNNYSAAFCVSANGSVVAGFSNSNGYEAFRWTQTGGMVGLGFLPYGYNQSYAYGISADGSKVVGTSLGYNGFEAFCWTASYGMQGLGDLTGGQFNSCAGKISGDGSIIIGGGNDANGPQAMVWMPIYGKSRLLDVLIANGADMSYWKNLANTGAISENGQWIVGTGLNINSVGEAYLANILPSPVITGQPNSQTVLFGQSASFNVTATGIEPLSYQWRKNGDNIDGATSRIYTIDSAQYSDSGNYDVIVSNDGGSVTSDAAVLTVLPSLQSGVDDPDLTWTTGGNALWFGETTITHDGVDALQSGAITDSQQSWLETTITGPGWLEFWWKVSSEDTYDKLLFKMDNGAQIKQGISGEVDWQHRTFTIPAGEHTLTWTYSKDESVSAGMDAGWLDEVFFHPFPANAPQNVSASDGTFSDKVHIVWAAAAYADQYEVWRGADSNLANAVHISTGNDPTGTAYDDTTSQFDTTYYYWVKAMNQYGASDFCLPDTGYASSDADGDGLHYLLELFIGADPNISDAQKADCTVKKVSDKWVFTYRQAKDTHGVIGSVWWSTDLQNWNDTNLSIRSITDLGNAWQIDMQLPAADRNQIFFRLLVEN